MDVRTAADNVGRKRPFPPSDVGNRKEQSQPQSSRGPDKADQHLVSEPGNRAGAGREPQQGLLGDQPAKKPASGYDQQRDRGSQRQDEPPAKKYFSDQQRDQHESRDARRGHEDSRGHRSREDNRSKGYSGRDSDRRSGESSRDSGDRGDRRSGDRGGSSRESSGYGRHSEREKPSERERPAERDSQRYPARDSGDRRDGSRTSSRGRDERRDRSPVRGRSSDTGSTRPGELSRGQPDTRRGPPPSSSDMSRGQKQESSRGDPFLSMAQRPTDSQETRTPDYLRSQLIEKSRDRPMESLHGATGHMSRDQSRDYRDPQRSRDTLPHTEGSREYARDADRDRYDPNVDRSMPPVGSDRTDSYRSYSGSQHVEPARDRPVDPVRGRPDLQSRADIQDPSYSARNDQRGFFGVEASSRPIETDRGRGQSSNAGRLLDSARPGATDYYANSDRGGREYLSGASGGSSLRELPPSQAAPSRQTQPARGEPPKGMLESQRYDPHGRSRQATAASAEDQRMPQQDSFRQPVGASMHDHRTAGQSMSRPSAVSSIVDQRAGIQGNVAQRGHDDMRAGASSNYGSRYPADASRDTYGQPPRESQKPDTTRGPYQRDPYPTDTQSRYATQAPSKDISNRAPTGQYNAPGSKREFSSRDPLPYGQQALSQDVKRSRIDDDRDVYPPTQSGGYQSDRRSAEAADIYRDSARGYTSDTSYTSTKTTPSSSSLYYPDRYATSGYGNVERTATDYSIGAAGQNRQDRRPDTTSRDFPVVNAGRVDPSRGLDQR